MDAPAEQFIDGLAGRLALDVPKRDLDAREHTHQRGVGPQGVARAIGLAPQGLEVEWVHAFDVAHEDIFDHGRQRLRPESIAIDFADAADIVVGRQLDEDEIASAPARRRIADDEYLEIPDFHLSCSLPLFRLNIAGAMRRCKSHPRSPVQPAEAARRAPGSASAKRSSSSSGATLTLMHRLSRSAPGMRTKMPCAIRASSTRLAKAPSPPQSMVT